MTTLIGVVSLALTAVYAWFTYQMLRANRRTVALIARHGHEERHLRLREQFLTGITSIIQFDLQSPGCEQALRLFNLLSSFALNAREEDRVELLALLDTALSLPLRAGIRGDAEAFPQADVAVRELDRSAGQVRRWMTVVVRDDGSTPTAANQPNA